MHIGLSRSYRLAGPGTSTVMSVSSAADPGDALVIV
jgi:hypothetical protein